MVEIQNVFAKLSGLGGYESIGRVEIPSDIAGKEEVIKPVVPMDAAFGSPDKVFCMICGKGFKSMKRHIGAIHGLKPGQYRRQFGIPAGTPLVSREYSDRRKKMAKKTNLAERLVKARAVRGGNG